MKKIGYARVSTQMQCLDRQLKSLEGEGCDQIFCDKMSGKNMHGRPELQAAIACLEKGDIFIISEWDRSTRSMVDGIALMQKIHALGATIKVLDRPAMDLTTPLGQGFLAFLSAMAQDERERIVKRSKQGLAAAKERGVKLGPKYKLTDEERAIALELFTHKDRTQRKSAREIAESFGVSPSTIARLRRK